MTVSSKKKNQKKASAPAKEVSISPVKELTIPHTPKAKAIMEEIPLNGLTDMEQMKLLFQTFPVDSPDVIKGDMTKSAVADAVMPVQEKKKKK